MSMLKVFEGVPVIIDNDEPWVLDENLAKALGYARVRDIRQLIARHTPFLPGIRQRCTVQRYESRPGVYQNRQVTEYILSEAHALYIAAKSNTLRANQLLQGVIKAFLEARAFIKRLILAPLETVQKELEELRAMYRADLQKKEEELALARSSSGTATVAIPRPGERTTLTLTNNVDTSDGKMLHELQREFGLPAKGKNAQVVRIIAQQMGIWNDANYVYILKVDVRDNTSFRNPARKYKPIAVQMMAHTIIRKARQLGYTVPPETIQKYGDPNATGTQVTYTDGIPTITPRRNNVVPLHRSNNQ